MGMHALELKNDTDSTVRLTSTKRHDWRFLLRKVENPMHWWWTFLKLYLPESRSTRTSLIMKKSGFPWIELCKNAKSLHHLKAIHLPHSHFHTYSFFTSFKVHLLASLWKKRDFVFPMGGMLLGKYIVWLYHIF
jgi:hypothetical protein